MAIRSGYGSFFRFVRWLALLALALAIYLAVKNPSGLPAMPSADAVTQDYAKFEQKVLLLSEARAHNEGTSARFAANEINSALVKNAASNGDKDSRVALAGNQLTYYFARNIFSLEVFLQLTGKLGLSHGRLTFTPSEIKLGDLPLPLSWTNPVIQKKLREPDVQEQLRMPDFVSRVEVNNGELVIDEFPKKR